ncbi:MAG: hypothetical protein DMG77_18320 [Acidobacteria bacterium]|nr:MAG: hypothetical protein DMG77_18320 [Acidobacteriota bacterium]
MLSESKHPYPTTSLESCHVRSPASASPEGSLQKDSLHSQPEPSIAALFEARVCSEGGPVLKGNSVLKGRVFQPRRKCHTINRGFSH